MVISSFINIKHYLLTSSYYDKWEFSSLQHLTLSPPTKFDSYITILVSQLVTLATLLNATLNCDFLDY